MQEISLNILDIAQNSVTADATLIEITVDEQTQSDRLIVEVKDNGKGMDEQQVKAVTDPFYTTRTTRRVGLGIPFFKMAAEMAQGSFEVKSALGLGTTVKAEFQLSHIDRMPLGDINSTIAMLIYCNPQLDFVYRRNRADISFTLDTREMRELLGGLPLNNGEVTAWVKDYLDEGEKSLNVVNGI